MKGAVTVGRYGFAPSAAKRIEDYNAKSAPAIETVRVDEVGGAWWVHVNDTDVYLSVSVHDARDALRSMLKRLGLTAADLVRLDGNP